MALDRKQVKRLAAYRWVSRAFSWCLALLYSRTLWVLGVVLCLVISVMFWHIEKLSTSLIQTAALNNAELFSKALAEVRTLYTDDVVIKARQNGLKVTHDYFNRPDAIPLPATFSMKLGERIGDAHSGMSVRLYSDYPFPWRKNEGGPHDPFERDALRELTQNPNQPFYRFEVYQGRLSIRYAIADVMRARCVDCHNTHPDSPRTDWKLGDVRGVLELISPLDKANQHVQAGPQGTIILMVVMSSIGLLGFMLVFSKIRSSTMETRRANTELKQAVRSLDHKNEELSVTKRVVELTNESLVLRAQELEQAQRSAENLLRVMEVAQTHANTANQAKSEFLANMSHEIRTPMTAIVGYTDLLLDPQQSPNEHLNCVQTIRRNSEHLLTLINDILDLSKIEAGKMTIEQIKCSPSQVVFEVISLMRPRALGANLAINVEFITPIPEVIQSDPTRLRQILVNLVGNAVKFTETGGVRVLGSLTVDPNTREPKIKFEVIDTGIGMSQAQMQRLFQPFCQADNSMTRRFGGTGLGLTISRRLAQMLGGDIQVRSTPGQGTSFEVTVTTGPLDGVPMIDRPTESVNHEASRKPTDPKSLKLTCRILLAEDGPDNQRLIAFHLRKAGAEVTLAENGRIAFDAAMKAVETGKPFDVILMDMQMPELDGYSATNLLRSKGYNKPIIALTAHAMAGDREKCLQAGCNDYTTKPIDVSKLIALINSFLS
jgi:signal transduction histidine kinase